MAKQQTPKKTNVEKGVNKSKQENFSREGAESTKGSGTSTRPKKDSK